MANSIITLDDVGGALAGSRRRSRQRRSNDLGAPRHGECKIVRNPRTKTSIQLCYVGKSRKHPTGWAFRSGTSRR